MARIYCVVLALFVSLFPHPCFPNSEVSLNTASVPPTAHPVSSYAAPQRVGTLWLSWAAIIAGVVVSMAVHIGLIELCISAGLALYEPLESSASGQAITTGTVIAIGVAGLISIFLGGWVAGRMKRHGNRIEAAVHGGLVWALSSVLTVVLAVMTVGAVVAGTASLVGKGVSAAASGAGSAVKGIANMAAPMVDGMSLPSWDAIRKEVEGAMESMDRGMTADGGDAARSGAQTRYADRSRLMQLLGRAFSLNNERPLTEVEETELRNLLATQLGISPEAAQQTLDQWEQVWNEGVERFEAAQLQALQAAEAAKEATAQASFIAFIVMLLSLVAAVGGAIVGSMCAWKCERECLAERPGQVPTTY